MACTTGSEDVVIRDATPADSGRLNEIYNWTIVDNHVSFDIEPWDEPRRRQWFADRGEDLHCLVAELDGYVIGLTYSSRYRPKPAYRSSLETTIVLDTTYLGRGVGSSLLSALIQRLRDQGTHMAIAIVALPNEASIVMHQRLGYRIVGTITDAGMKYGRYYDTTILELALH